MREHFGFVKSSMLSQNSESLTPSPAPSPSASASVSVTRSNQKRKRDNNDELTSISGGVPSYGAHPSFSRPPQYSPQMGGSTGNSLFGLFKKLQEVLSSGASSSCPPVLPELTRLNDEVYEVYSPLPEKKPDLEIIFFHGLQLRYCKEAYSTTWMSHDNSHMWLKTWLVEEFPGARILTIAYDSSTQRSTEVGNLGMYCTAENLVSSLTSDAVRVGHAKCPVVLVGHCMGGLVLKEVCRTAAWMLGRKSAELPEVKRIEKLLSNLRGMFFYGTPHAGSVLFDEVHSNLEGALMREIQILNAPSARKNEEFRDLKLQYNWLTYGIGEQQETLVHRLGSALFNNELLDLFLQECLGKRIHVVEEASARLNMDAYYSASTNHFEICKPHGKLDSTFQFFTNFLRKIQEDGTYEAQAFDDSESSQDYVIDLQNRARQVRNMLAQPDANMIFITGFSGIGKSTLAERVFHDMQQNFALTCFVRLESTEGSSNLKEEVLKKVQHGLVGDNNPSTRGYRHVLSRLKGKDVLMVLDNVESQDQINALCTKAWLQGSNSRLIITTKFCMGTTSNRFQVPFLSDKESSELFLHYAFEGGEGPPEVRDCMQLVIERCESLPLSLKILGSYVSTWRNVNERQLWAELLERMKRAEEVECCHDYKLWAKLKPSYYYGLGPSEKEMFLDIATMFHGCCFSMVECIWNACQQSPKMAWENLNRRFLCSVDTEGKIWMHSQLRDMGRSIAGPRSLTIDKWSRVSEATFARRLIENYQGHVEVLGLKLQKAENKTLLFASGTFLPYVQLQYLILDGVQMIGDSVQLPVSLVYLKWTNGVFHICPVDFTRLEKLVVLDLSRCQAMKMFGTSLADARKLEWLELEGCRSLTDEALGEFKFYHLKYFGVSRTSLTKLPRGLGKSKDLTSLQAEETRLTRVPQWVERLTMLVSLNFQGTQVTSLPEAIGNLKLLKTLKLKETRITCLPDSVGEILGLQHLDLSFTALESFPQPILKLRSLKHLTFYRTQISTVPHAIGELVELDRLVLHDTGLATVPKTIGQLLGLRTLYIPISRDESLQHLASLKSLQILWLDIGEESILPVRDENSQTEFSSLLSPLLSLPDLISLRLKGVNFPQSLLSPLLSAVQQLLPSLDQLCFYGFNLVETMPCELGALTGLNKMTICDCVRLRELPESLGNLWKLLFLNLYRLPRLSKLPESLGALPALSRLRIYDCASLQSMPRSMGHVSPLEQDSFSSESNERSPSESPQRLLTGQLQSMELETTSWTLLECFLKCCRGHASSQRGEYLAKCEEMERIMEASGEREGGGYVADTKVAAELFKEMNLRVQGREIGIPEGSESSTSHPPWHHCTKLQNVDVICFLPYDDIRTGYALCDVHTGWVRVMDLDERSDESIQDADSETSEDDESVEDAASETCKDNLS